jgi:hypothetical protein
MQIGTIRPFVSVVLGAIGLAAVTAAPVLAQVPVAGVHAPSDTVAAAKPTPPPSTGSTFATAYSVPSSYSVAESISQASNGGFIVGALFSSATVLGVDSSGNLQAQTQYSYGTGPQSTALNILKATADGGAIFAGQPQAGCPAQSLEFCGAIVKVDSAGKVQWANDLLFANATPYSSPKTWPFDIQQTTDGGFVLVGYTYGPSVYYNPWIAKLSSTGQLQWTHVFVDPQSQYSAASSVRQTADGGYLVGGEVSYAITPSYTESDITVFKLDATGTLVWQRDYAAGEDAYVQSLALTSDGGAIVSGTVDTQNTATSYTSSVLLMKLDSTGNVQFARTILPSGSISDLNVVGAQQTADGGYAFAGYYFQNTVYTERAWLVKTDSAGNVQWDKIYGPDVQYSDRYFHSFQQTSDGGFVAAGSTNQFNGGDSSIWLVKTDSNGNIAKCADIHNDAAATGSIAVTVSNGNLAAVSDSASYVADKLIQSSAPLAATKEC